MEWMNYHHLLYFWMVAKEGGVSRAAKVLRLAQPTVSGQLRAFEDTIGEKLFDRVGRGLVLTDVGRMVFRYADELFSIGRELQDALKGRPTGRPLRFAVGIADVVPKLVAYRLLEPALQVPEQIQLICHEDRSERLIAQLAAHELDLVLSDSPATTTLNVRVFSHLLGQSGISFFAAPVHAGMKKRFPQSLDGQPFLMPAPGWNLRRSLEQWFEGLGVRPRIVGEFDDTALLKVFGQAGAGAFAAPTVTEAEIVRQFHVKVIGRVDEPHERFYAISAERRLKHPAVLAVSNAARKEIFAQKPPPVSAAAE